jgi:cytochrome c553
VNAAPIEAAETKRSCARALIALAICVASLDVSADTKAGEAKAQLCLLCHKPESLGTPVLEAQPAEYLMSAIWAYKKGVRSDPSMQANVARLTPRDVDDIAAYFAARPPIARRGESGAAEGLAAGEQRVIELGCAACHQPGFTGLALVPRLAGQSRGYLARQLEDFAIGRRKHPPAAMPANEGTDNESVANYLASLR